MSSASATPRAIAMTITAEVAARHRVSVALMMSPGRTRAAVDARSEAYVKIALAFPAWSISQLSAFFGRHHTTLVASFQKHGYPHSGFLVTNQGKSPRNIRQDVLRETSDTAHINNSPPTQPIEQRGETKCRINSPNSGNVDQTSELPTCVA